MVNKEKYTYEDFLEIIKTLRAPAGCPWDREQTHDSLRPCMLEEAYEFLSSVRILEETGSADNMCEELGDLLLQIVMHAEIADEEGLFTMEDVVNEISRKMVRRHPHVFGTTEVSGVSDVLTNWDDIKKKEKEGKTWIASPLKEIPAEQPALTRASKVLKKVHKVYEPILDYETSLDKLGASIEILKQRGRDIPQGELEKEIGKMLMELSAIAAEKKVYSEQLLVDCVEGIIRKYEK